tara:strand:- start:28 stop:237 length:210 start_codon:yes stop_codon:yes gene_type:complete
MQKKTIDKLEKKSEEIEKFADKISILCQEINDIIEKERENQDGSLDEFDEDEQYQEDEFEEDIDEDEDK